MNTKDLKSFLQVCKDGSITKAAKSLYITPQGLSKIIINLEQELQIPLFYRTANGLTLSEYGELLLEKAKYIISELEGIENYFTNLNNITGQIKLASSYGVIAAFSPEFLLDFRKRIPNISLKWWEYSDLRAENAVLNGEADCGLIKGPINNEQLYSKLIASYKVMLLVPKNHPLANKKSISLKELKNEKIIIENSEFKIYHNFNDACKKSGFTPSIVFETTELSLAHKLCQRGMGLAVTVDFAVKDMPMPELKGINIKEDEPKWEIYFVAKKDTINNPTVKYFEKYIMDFIESNLENN